MKLQIIADNLGSAVNDGSVEISAISSLDDAADGQISFLTNVSYASKLADTKASAVIVPKDTDINSAAQLLLVDDVDAAVDQLLLLFAPEQAEPDQPIHPSATISSDAVLGRNVVIGPSVVVDKGAVIGDNTVIEAGTYIGQKVKIGSNCRIWPNVVINNFSIIGDKVDINSNTTIGSEGFGYRVVNGKHKHIPHIGNVIIEDEVEIGANVCVDRAKFGSTIIGSGTKIDNLVQVAHNVKIGSNCIIIAQTGIAGSSKIGNFVIISGQVAISDHAVIEDFAMLGPRTGILQGQVVASGSKVMGIPAQNIKDEMRQIAVIKKLPEIHRKVNKLFKKMEEK